MSYVDEALARVAGQNSHEPEFIQAVTEVLESLRTVIEANEEDYRRNASVFPVSARICAPCRNLSSPAKTAT